MMPFSFGETVDGIRYLSVDDIIYINKRLIESQTPNEPIKIINKNSLGSSQSRPSLVRYYEQTNDMFVLSAALIESLIQNHPFANANKRTALMSGYVFLLINGYELTAPGSEIVEMACGLAQKYYSSQELENWLCYWSRSYDVMDLCNLSINDLISSN
ncbi:type II toxin-antitoxin system death-on-curing family toxin [Candidatus Arsenophonus nilaparvatae]|nr:type II toxin-antitoxin system death-on-curing family toxin [Candidatus Arsenophonus nilaparvatae]